MARGRKAGDTRHPSKAWGPCVLLRALRFLTAQEGVAQGGDGAKLSSRKSGVAEPPMEAGLGEGEGVPAYGTHWP